MLRLLVFFTLVSDGTSLTKCLLPHEVFHFSDNREENQDLPVLIVAKTYLDNYFSGSTSLILPPLRPAVTPYTEKVLKEALNIPYGETISYHELAVRLNKPTHARSVGNALGKNPLPIFYSMPPDCKKRQFTWRIYWRTSF